jgi:hypothetical protein
MTPGFGVDDQERKHRREILEKRSASGLEKRWQQEDRADLEVSQAAMAPPVVTVPQCHVCTYTWRAHIERQILAGYSFSRIAQNLPPDPETRKTPDRRSISKHSKEHMNTDSAVIRAVLEEEAGKLGQQWEDGVKGAFTMRGALEVMVRKGFDDAMSGLTTVEPRDIIQMIKAYNEMSSNASTMATETAEMTVRIFVEAIQNVLMKGDFVELDLGKMLAREIANETVRLRERDEIDTEIERQLDLRPPRSYDSDAEEIRNPQQLEP